MSLDNKALKRYRSFDSTTSTKMSVAHRKEMFNSTQFGFFPNLEPKRSRVRKHRFPSFHEPAEKCDPLLLSQVLQLDDRLMHRSTKLNRPADYNRASYLSKLLTDHREKIRIREEYLSDRTPYTQSFHYRKLQT